MAMTFDTLMPSFLARSGAPLHGQTSSFSARKGALPRLALLLALGISSACKGQTAEGGASGGGDGGGGSSGSITVSPLGDAHIGPQDALDPARLLRTYVLSNGTSEPLSWEVRLSEPWLSLAGPESGVLAPGESVEVLVDVDPYTASKSEIEPAVAEVVFLASGTGAVLGTCTVTIESSFALQSSGWTTFAPSADTHTVFVSSSGGDDRNDGLSPATAKRTIAAAKELLRHGFPDWLLLKRGDVWQESLGQWKKSGRSPGEPMLVSTYGAAPDRPLLRTGTRGGIWTNGGGGSPSTVDYLAVVGLHLLPDGYTGGGDCVGAQFFQPGSNLLIEDCKIEGYSTDLVFQGYGGRHTDFRLRRSVIVDAYNDHSTGEHSQGLYVYGVDGLLIEENVFDHNGWSETVPGANADIYSHNLYIDNGNTGIVVRGNLIANGSSHGLQLRCGGSVVNNLFVRNSISLLVGGGNNPEAGGVRAEVFGNVILDGKNIDAANPRGWGMVFSNLSSGRVAYNVVANNELGAQPAAMILDGDEVGDNGLGVGVHDTAIVGNIFYNWGGGILVEGTPSQITNLRFLRNDIQNATLPAPLLEHFAAGTTAAIHSRRNRFFNQVVPTNAWTEIEHVPRSLDYWMAQVGDTTSVVERVTYDEPERSLESYNVLIGGPYSYEAFLAEARRQSSTHWRLVYMASQANRYIRAGF